MCVFFVPLHSISKYVMPMKHMLSSKEYNKYEYDGRGNILVKWKYTSSGEDDNYVLSAKYVYFY